ncbi:MAG: undecaprenyldiphospho-muramoylpentapeptide beta-N-acetylglucosaminyltransferase [Treponema sp.]|jgi:UDP-N-acetylglucosamine--N-acetylmuramyl-(pentapeptide) pyrophosphoryl-undecaprenol N-acetylglucosamine transferase|nr:undecaprenyldiphospho-muramoylpentapeptide beta-N-acetylglucosaminyltransferase [Treponema sp.]
MSNCPKIAFAGGGTGGHIYPGLAVAAELKKKECSVFWIGSKKELDRRIVEGTGIQFFDIPSGKLRRYFSLQNFADVFRTIAGFFAARNILKKEKPALLFSKGGFVSVPPVIAAFSLKIPVFTHESDFSPGLATRINSFFSEKILVSYHETVSKFKVQMRKKVQVTGNPVRRIFRSTDAESGRRFLGVEGPILLVLGGSQGAREINNIVMDNLEALTRFYTVVHQTGAMDAERTPPVSPRYKPLQYIGEEMPYILAAADMVLSRSGAGTVWECASAGKPMLLVPLRGSGTRGDQVENARFFEQAGAAIVQTDAKSIVQTALSLGEDESKLRAMSHAASEVGALDGTEEITRMILFRNHQKKHF